MIETIIVCVIVGAVLLFAGRSLYRTLTGKTDGCACGTKSCPASGRCSSLEVSEKKQEKQ
jgi:hypothetical protein